MENAAWNARAAALDCAAPQRSGADQGYALPVKLGRRFSWNAANPSR